MRLPSHWIISLGLVACILFGASTAAAQVFVYPRRPGQTNVRYSDFNWEYVHVFTGPEASIDSTGGGPRGGADLTEMTARPEGSPIVRRQPRLLPATGGPSSGHEAADTSESPSREKRLEALESRAGGLRLYYYRDEEVVAQRAVVTIKDLYRDLMLDFDFAPPETFAFILYNSYYEFLQTNLFPVQEGVLGVTSPRSLELTLPYFGDHRQFERVAKHELVHEFTIQKIRSLARKKGAFQEPVQQFPLWFIEGLAEYYTHDGLDPETRMLVRDLIVNPVPSRGYVFGGFFEARFRGYLGVYKLGQAKCAFLQETYGDDTLQSILDQSYRLGLSRSKKGRVPSFRRLVERITGDDADTIGEKFEEWIKRDSYETYLSASQYSSQLEEPYRVDRYLQAFDTSQSGRLLAYKAIDRTTGQNRLFVADYRDPYSEEQIVVDGQPGVESLHPLANRNFDVTEESVVFVARSKGRDVLYWQRFSHETHGGGGTSNAEKTGESEASGEKTDSTNDASNTRSADEKARRVRAEIDLGGRTRYALDREGIMAAEAPAIGPKGRRVAFIGMDRKGQKDLFVLERSEGGDVELTRLTDDVFAERGLAWSSEGLVYASDETGHGKYNLFRLAPSPDADPTRLTSEPRDHLDPAILGDGTVAFVAYDGARANVYTVGDSSIHQRTNVSTGLFNPSAGPDGSLWALHHEGGTRTPTRVPAEEFETVDTRSASPTSSTHRPLTSASLDGSRNYSAFHPGNWQFDSGFGLLGVTGSGVYGQLFASASDQLRDHRLLLEMIAFGSFRRTDGSLTYINQSNRILWGLSAFQDFRFRVDETFEELDSFISNDRFYGLRGLLRYPFSRFAYIQFDAAAGGVSYFLPDGSKEFLSKDAELNLADPVGRWTELNDSPRFQGETTLSLGFDTITYQRQTGPLSGGSLLASITGDYQPFDGPVFGSTRVDGEVYFPIYGRINAFLRAGTGKALGGRFARQFFLSSYYTLRGVPFGDQRFLLGRNFFFSTLELQFPLNYLVSIPFVDVEGIVGTDFGGVGDSYPGLWERRVLNIAWGVNLGLGPLVFRVQFARPFDIGAPLPIGGDSKIVPNLTFGWRYL